MENNKKSRFLAVNLHKKQYWAHQNFTGTYEKSVEIMDELQDTENIKSEKVNKLCQKSFDQH